MADSLGIYISVPFCKAKCTFCNFASKAFPPERMDAYVERLCEEIAAAQTFAAPHALSVPPVCDSLFLGGGTPSLLSAEQVHTIFGALRRTFAFKEDAEITVEAAPGQMDDAVLDALLEEGVNRISFGVQSFVDAEACAVARLHTAAQCITEIERVRARGIRNVNLDLIAGLPHQTEESWQHSLDQAVSTGVDHVSVYMLEIDEDSRLGRELIGPNVRYGAQATPDEAVTAELYIQACETLERGRFAQYEISNFAKPGHQSRHNRKYWERAPYLGFGLDAHSMLLSEKGAVRFANTDDLDTYISQSQEDQSARAVDIIGTLAAFEEAIFLGLRLREGLSIAGLRREHASGLIDPLLESVRDLSRAGLMMIDGDHMQLTTRGLLVSSSVFGELLTYAAA